MGGKGILSALQMHQTSVWLLPPTKSYWELCVHTGAAAAPHGRRQTLSRGELAWLSRGESVQAAPVLQENPG